MKSISVSVGTAPVLCVASDDFNRTVYLHNAGSGKIYLGGSSVTSSTGFHLANAESVSLFIPQKETLYAVTASSTHAVIVLTPDTD